MFSKMLVTRFSTQPDIWLMRSTRPVTKAMAPSVMLSRLHSHRARPVVPAISSPFRVNSSAVIRVVRRT
jgi:hypothetical protein